ncbi:hypothetical protein BRADI_2g59933v3 [Brachypodium distachyon]|uniref:Uncharacterized protein n=1 Tax=Brachypodium distachyon TaxID=15368 RepID=A0A0Q3N400_BRADI|nr:hypothetical protein BRADI_2g59933v3 [Brachypodium distachyon]
MCFSSLQRYREIHFQLPSNQIASPRSTIQHTHNPRDHQPNKISHK